MEDLSVVKGLRTEGKLVTQTKAYDFASYTHQIVSNEKVFLKRYRWCSTAKIVEAVDEIAVLVDLANNINVKKSLPAESLKKNLELRRQYQTKAIEVSYRVETLMEIAYRDNNREGRHIDDNKINYWVGLLLELRSQIRKWRESEQG